jgi:hypothetical protein
VPLTVEEPAGVARQLEPVTCGVPLPRGLTRDVTRLSSDYGVTSDGLDLDNNTRSIGHRLFAMMKAWIASTGSSTPRTQDGDILRLKRLNSRTVWQPRFRNGYSEQAWTYGITLEAMAQAHLLTRRREMRGYMKRATDWLLANPQEWHPAMAESSANR